MASPYSRWKSTPPTLAPVTLGASGDLRALGRGHRHRQPFWPRRLHAHHGRHRSALDRTIEGPDNRTINGIIQTGAAINKGNSGGRCSTRASPAVIGITSAISARPTGTSAGVGFAIAVDTLKRILPDLLTTAATGTLAWASPRIQHHAGPGRSHPAAGVGGSVAGAVVRWFAAGRRRYSRRTDRKFSATSALYLGGDIVTAVDGQAIAQISQSNRS